MVVMKRAEALRLGLTRYFTGKPCKNGHVAERFTKHASCVECNKQKLARIRKYDPAYMMWHDARKRARRHDVPFSITLDDIVIPERCPILGLRIEKNDGWSRDNSPSLDRIVPALGYVPGNVRVISHRANALKSNATRAELEAVLSDLIEIEGGAP